MAVKWTQEQEQVIELQNRNILVSAAAGSGKTAVLVERILHKMLRAENPVDIDRLLIVTFTRAAAAEMRERLIGAIEKRLEEEPENEHLQRQQTLIHNAQITTIDGFCSYVIRNYFHTIDLDPGFRTAEEGERKLLKYDVAKELLEAEYAEATDTFRNFTEIFAAGKTDDELIELILKLYEFSMSHPWPKEWLAQCAEPYQAETAEELCKSVWMKKLWLDVSHAMTQAVQLNQHFCRLTQESDGPYMYEEMGITDRIHLEKIQKAVDAQDFDMCYVLLDGYKYAVLSRKKDDTVSADKREKAKGLRDAYKTILADLKKNYFYADTKSVLEELQICREPVQELLRLTSCFIDAFAAKKQKKNLLDFSDMEHFALDILVRKENGTLVYTQAADEFSKRFEEILIDEYQDSNFVQETLLESVSKLRYGVHNIFMVGDVKQSIYRFRLARPELFMNKYEKYSHEESECQRIDLHKNFRSREQVLSGVNFIFEQIMGKELGDVEYDEAAALYPGAVFPPEEVIGEDAHAVEILVAETDTQEWSDEEKADVAAQELEARMIGARIREIVGKEKVLDKVTGNYRLAQYRDCVILLRTVSGWSDSFANTLKEMGIPAYTTSQTGYFQTLEIRTILNYLKICDNPMQEIPFTGVLLSPIGGCTAKELALIKSAYPEHKIYECVWKYRQFGEEKEICQKLDRFLHQYEQIRSQLSYTPIHELVVLILHVTGYGNCAAAMPGGAQRAANLQMLVEKAMEFEKTSYRGLFNFCRYMEQLQKYQVDFGEVNTVSENEDAVRIMSIHKSKGLEFPIVFVAGMGKRFNMSDANAGLVIHPDLGIGMFAVSLQLRMKTPTLLRSVIQKQIRLESLGEELRVLYVALTRAKEKLILTGTIERWMDRMEQYCDILEETQKRLPYGTLEKAKDFWGWILPAMVRHPVMEEFVGEVRESFVSPSKVPFMLRMFSAGDLVCKEMRVQILGQQQYQELMSLSEDIVFDKKLREDLREKFSYQYPYRFLQEIPAKVSVSELKMQDMEDAQPLIPVPKEEEWIVPEFLRTQENTLQGAARGTAYHRVLELLDYGSAESLAGIQDDIEKMYAQERIDESVKNSVSALEIYRFLQSNIGQRMQAAWKGQVLWREQPFVMSISASEIYENWQSKEPILVQGIIDAFWEEEDGLVLVDYKTDRIQRGQEEVLAERYRTQLAYYARALERVRGKKVKEVYLYAFAIGKAIPIRF